MLSVNDYLNQVKLSSAAFLLLTLTWYGAWSSPTATSLVVMYSCYSILWFIKTVVFPDKAFAVGVPVSLGIGIIWLSLLPYSVGPFFMIRGHREIQPALLAGFQAAYIIGAFLHYVSDMQKHCHIELKPGLIKGGLFAWARNINYFGEALIYLTFTLVPSIALRNPLPLLYFLFVVWRMWWPRMVAKDKSLARHPGWAEYKAATPLFIPGLL